ncbi:hypothetical protein ACYFX5_14620 [Bremerella sp. T1]|uniref:hypothetical protein n=1 Tax=Bremerella sp. TYQ1 TaxID=3119568 RepID=UPI001CC97478|nr:hypothetical protein [Bremerella volcania]UBM34289.1 hypothetical protein LA756_16570 [Bremerella volcania]
MGVRKKGRARFECLGEYFVWYFDNYHLRLVSEDKSFVVAYFMGDPWGDEPHLEIHGMRFPGIARSETRPVRVVLPESIHNKFVESTGSFVNALIRWSLDETRQLEYYLPR